MKVAIIGTVPASRQLAPYNDPSWQIWGCSPGNQGQLPRVDRWYELHAHVDMMGMENRHWSVPYYAWLKAQSFPVYMQEPCDSVPQAKTFPRDALLARFGRNWFTSSVAWMMAHAIVEGAKEIGLFGIDMAATEEHYSWQKAGCTRFIEIAQELGITVVIPKESCLSIPGPLYGYSEATHFGRKMNVRLHEMLAQKQNLTANILRLQLEEAFFNGAIENHKYIMRTFTDGADYVLEGIKIIEPEAPKADLPLPVMSPALMPSPLAAAEANRARSDSPSTALFPDLTRYFPEAGQKPNGHLSPVEQLPPGPMDDPHMPQEAQPA